MIFRNGKPIEWDDVSEKRSTVTSVEKYADEKVLHSYLDLTPRRR